MRACAGGVAALHRPPVLELSYEALVADPETEARRLLDFLGLDWDARRLEHTAALGAVATASFWQVRKPVYRDALAGWRV